MAWVFTGFLSHHQIHGPLPVKHWVPRKGERHRKSYRTGAGPRAYAPSVDAQAEAYARWLAARDGVTIPEGLAARPVMAWFSSAHRTRKRKFWNGVREVPFEENRPRAVEFCPALEPARRSFYSGNNAAKLGEPVVTIALPNWDFDPAEPVEELLPLDAIAA